MLHTGKVLPCGAVGPRFNSRQGQGILMGLFCSVSGWHTTPVVRQVDLVLEHFPFTNAASHWLYVNLICRFYTRHGRFSQGTPVSSYTKKLESFHIFWFIFSGLSLCVQSLLDCMRFNNLCMRCCHTAAPSEPGGLICCALQKLQII